MIILYLISFYVNSVHHGIYQRHEFLPRRPGFLEASTSITEAPTEPPVEAVLVFDSAMPGMLPKAVWHSKVGFFGWKTMEF